MVTTIQVIRWIQYESNSTRHGRFSSSARNDNTTLSKNSEDEFHSQIKNTLVTLPVIIPASTESDSLPYIVGFSAAPISRGFGIEISKQALNMKRALSQSQLNF